MGYYRAIRSTPTSVALRHEGEDDHEIEISKTGAAPVPSWIVGQVEEGRLYVVSLGFSVLTPEPAKVEE
jgi:hypothetical protein